MELDLRIACVLLS